MRLIYASIIALAGMVITAAVVFAGNPHFVFVSTSTSGNTLTVSGKEAGLGDEDQVHIVVTADALCVNPGDNHPKAANKTSVTVAGDFPVQNGKADFNLSVVAVFQPQCSPPMSVVWQNIKVADTTNGLSNP